MENNNESNFRLSDYFRGKINFLGNMISVSFDKESNEYKYYNKMWSELFNEKSRECFDEKYDIIYSEVGKIYFGKKLEMVKQKLFNRYYQISFNVDIETATTAKYIYEKCEECFSLLMDKKLYLADLTLFDRISFINVNDDINVLSQLFNTDKADEFKYFIGTDKEKTTVKDNNGEVKEIEIVKHHLYYAKACADVVIMKKIDLNPSSDFSDSIRTVPFDEFSNNFISLDTFFANSEDVNTPILNFKSDEVNNKHLLYSIYAKARYGDFVLCINKDNLNNEVFYSFEDSNDVILDGNLHNIASSSNYAINSKIPNNVRKALENYTLCYKLDEILEGAKKQSFGIPNISKLERN